MKQAPAINPGESVFDYNKRIEAWIDSLEPETKLSGGNVNYYLVYVAHPQREGTVAYQAECDDIADALELMPDEKDIFKEIWRSANARKGNGKPGHKAIYGAEKIVHRADRILRRLKLKAQDEAQSTERPD